MGYVGIIAPPGRRCNAWAAWTCISSATLPGLSASIRVYRSSIVVKQVELLTRIQRVFRFGFHRAMAAGFSLGADILTSARSSNYWSDRMPIYEYECTACKQRFERFQSFSEPPVTECPACGSPVRKVLQPVGIIFKGSGWYKTEARNASAAGKAEAAKDSGTTAETKASGETKTDGSGKADASAKSDAPKAEGARSEGSKGDGGKSESSKSEAASKPAPAPATSASGQ